MTTDVVSPTDEQRAVIDLPAPSRAFVIAGPGAGKTWTLLTRARGLAERDEIEPSSLLVLSFTRAVVRELRARDKSMHSLATIFPETFDSFATRLLAAHAQDEGWRSRSFDARIVLATGLVADGSAKETLDHYEHIFVDEVQDLVGPRALFVSELLRAHKRGFTAFGDPAQAIYDHERGRSGPSFSDELLGGMADETLVLTHNHRAVPDLAEMTQSVREVLLRGDPEEAVTATDSAFIELPTLSEFEDLPDHVDLVTGDRAILCRDNATALLLSRALHARGIDHRIRRGSSDRPVAGWVAATLRASARTTESQFTTQLADLRSLGFPNLPDRDEGWRILCRMDFSGRGAAVTASEIGNRIALGRVPYELLDEPDHPLVISSVHRAKGLEFDACIIVEWPRREEEDGALESRVLFVALSRARRDCLHAGKRSKRDPWYRATDARNRFIKRGRQPWQTFGIEILGADVHDTDPAGAIELDADPSDVQSTLVASVRPGDPVSLELLGRHDFGRETFPYYAVKHTAGPIGITGMAFGGAMRSRLRDSAPERIDGIRIDDLETIRGSADTSDAAGLGRSGLWLRPRLVGLGEFTWKAE